MNNLNCLNLVLLLLRVVISRRKRGPTSSYIGKIVGLLAVCVDHCVLNAWMDEASADGVHHGHSTN